MEFESLKNKPVGFFDSGVGGISVLKQAVKLLPDENFIYFGDSKNAPYGTKTVEEVKLLSFKAVDFLLQKGAKAIVVACNTATSAAIDDLRIKYNNIPVIGIEPALKPAVELRRPGKIIIMATTVTLAEKKFSKLVDEYGKEADIEPLPCPGLVEFIEAGVVEGIEMHEFLMNKLERYSIKNIASVVLGCTHYPFISRELSKILGADVPIIDGSLGTARHLKVQLEKYKLLNDAKIQGKVEIYNSLEGKGIIELSYKLLEM